MKAFKRRLEQKEMEKNVKKSLFFQIFFWKEKLRKDRFSPTI